MNKCIVFYERWQMECCGIEFQTGDTVKWLVCNSYPLITPVDVGKVDYCYEAHDSDWKKIFVLEGIVEHIQILYERYAPLKDNPKLLAPVSGKLIASNCAKGFEKDVDDMKPSGYIVDIIRYLIRPAKKEEVTFK